MKRHNSIRIFLTVAFAAGLIFQQAVVVQAAHGDPDYSFGFHGVKTDHVSGKDMYPVAIAQQADGKLLVAGYMTGTGYPFRLLVLRRYNTNGSVDTGFGLSGFGVEILNGQPWYIYGEGHSLTVQTDGKIVVAGGYYSFGSSEKNPAVFRFLPSGDLDTSFGDEGRATFGEEFTNHALGIAIYKGRLLTTIPLPESQRRLVRLNSDGTLDTAFGVSGMADIGINYSTFTLNRKSSKIILGGSAHDVYPDTPALQHFNTNGTPDTSHGSDGIVVLDTTPGCVGYYVHAVLSLDTQADGKIIAGTTCGSPGSGPYNSVVRLLPDDSLDPGFGSGGYAIEGEDSNTVVRVGVSRTVTQIMALGHSGTHSLKRYGSTGLLQLSFAGTYSPVAELLIQSNDEKPVILQNPYSGDIRLRRFLP